MAQLLSEATPAAVPSARLVGQHGNTSKGRLDRLDALLELYEPALFAVPSAALAPLDVCVDVGFGDAVDTLADFAARLGPRRASGSLRIVGTELDPARLESGRVALAAELQRDSSSLALRQGEDQGWFVLPLEDPEPPPVFIRALNVLRDYHPSDALRALQTLGAQLAPGGLLMEGSASTPGHTAVVALVRRGVAAQPSVTADAAGKEEGLAVLRLEALCFCVDFDRRDAPKLKGASNRWFTRLIPQLWQHQHTKNANAAPGTEGASDGGNSSGGSGTGKKRKRGGDRKWLGGGGCVQPPAPLTLCSWSSRPTHSFRNPFRPSASAEAWLKRWYAPA